MRKLAASGVYLLLAMAGAETVYANCISRGVYYKETYCFSDPVSDEVTIDIEQAPSIDEQVTAFLANAKAHIADGNTLAAWTEIDTALRLNPSDASALALQASLNQILTEVQQREEEEAQRAAIQRLKDEAQQLAQAGQLHEAMDVIRQARHQAPYDFNILKLMMGIKDQILESGALQRQHEDAARKEAYEKAQRGAQAETAAALGRLADRLNGPSWQELATGVNVSRESETAGSLDEASRLLQIPFDRIEKLVSGPALELLNGNPGPMAKKVEARNLFQTGVISQSQFDEMSGVSQDSPDPSAPIDQEVKELVDQIDYWEGRERELEAAATTEADVAARQELARKIDVVQGIKVLPRVKLKNLGVLTPNQQ